MPPRKETNVEKVKEQLLKAYPSKVARKRSQQIVVNEKDEYHARCYHATRLHLCRLQRCGARTDTGHLESDTWTDRLWFLFVVDPS